VQTTLGGALGSVASGSTASIIVNSITGFPAKFPFTLIIEWNTNNSEVVTITQAATGAGPFTYANSIRGDDNSNAPAHSNGASVVHGPAARDFYDGGHDWVNILAFPYNADPTGTLDSTTAIQTALNTAGNGVVYIPAGTYKTSSAITLPANWSGRITGSTYSASVIQNAVSDLMNMNPATLSDSAEIDHIQFKSQVGGGHIFSGANLSRFYLHDCRMTQNNPSKAIWNGAALVQLVECAFERNYEWYTGASRTIEAWILTCSAPNINNNRWANIRQFNVQPDGTNYAMHLAYNGSSGTGLKNNQFVNITNQSPNGGFMLFESCQGTVIDSCFAWDLTTNTWGNHLFAFKKNATATTGCVQTIMRNCGRNGGTGKGAFDDINLDVNSSNTLLEQYLAQTGGNAVTINLNASAAVTLIGCSVAPANPTTDTLTIGQGKFTVNATAITVP
jgi:hypothetical protein